MIRIQLNDGKGNIDFDAEFEAGVSVATSLNAELDYSENVKFIQWDELTDKQRSSAVDISAALETIGLNIKNLHNSIG